MKLLPAVNRGLAPIAHRGHELHRLKEKLGDPGLRSLSQDKPGSRKGVRSTAFLKILLASVVGFGSTGATAAVSVQPVLIGPEFVSGPLDWALFLQDFPLVWKGPAPVNPDFKNVHFDIDFTITTLFTGQLNPGRSVCLNNVYRFQLYSQVGPDDKSFPYVLTDGYCFLNDSGEDALPYSITDVKSFSQSFSIEIDPVVDFDFGSDTFFLLDGAARTPDLEGAVTREEEFVTIAGEVRVTIDSVPTPAALPLFALGLAPLALRRRDGFKSLRALSPTVIQL